MRFPRYLLSFFPLCLCVFLVHPLGAQVLKQSTAVTVQIGPAVAASDGNTEVAEKAAIYAMYQN